MYPFIFQEKEGPRPSPERKRLLRDTHVDESGPGTVLRDFEAMLTYIKEHQPRVTPKQRLLPLSSLSEINERLTHPLQLGLKRPMQKSHPPIHGLYLLVRATGLTMVRERGKTPSLVVDDAVARAWADLNPTERYFALLETWLLRGKADIVGERDRSFGLVPENFREWRSFAMQIPDQGLPVAGAEAEGWLTYTPGWHNLGLLDLFGLVRIHDAPSEPGEGWHIERIERTPFGDALLILLQAEFFGDWHRLSGLEMEQRVPFGVLQPVIQPYFPEWKKNLSLPEEEFREGTYVFKVSLGRIWRRIAIPSDGSLDTLAHAILDAVEFDYDHLYEFTYRNRFGAKERVNHPYMDEGPWTPEVLIGDLPLQVGQMMTFVFDFGDWWEFDVTLERIDPVDPSIRGPVLLEEHGEAPEQYRSWGEW